MDGSIMVIARTNRSLRPIESALADAGVPYKLIGHSGFWSTPEVRTALAFLQAAMFPSDWCLVSCLSSPFRITQYLPKAKIKARLKEIQTDKQPSYWHLLSKEPHQVVETKNLESVRDFVSVIHGLSRYRNLRAGDALKRILVQLQAFDYYADDETPDNSPIDNLNDLLKIADRFDDIPKFLDYSRRVAAAAKKKAQVSLGTCHSVKGLEADHVWFIACNEGVIPHAKSTDLQEEKNVFFVGASRAAKTLTITYSGVPSPFLKNVREMDEVSA